MRGYITFEEVIGENILSLCIPQFILSYMQFSLSLKALQLLSSLEVELWHTSTCHTGYLFWVSHQYFNENEPIQGYVCVYFNTQNCEFWKADCTGDLIKKLTLAEVKVLTKNLNNFT